MKKKILSEEGGKIVRVYFVHVFVHKCKGTHMYADICTNMHTK